MGFKALSAKDQPLFRCPWLDGPTALAAVLTFTQQMTLAATVALPVVCGPVALAKSLAAMFEPLRGRIHSLVDRGFYRRKYDAEKTLKAFCAKLKNETDLEALNNELVGVVRETMQPAYVPLLPRPDMPRNGEEADV